MAEYIEREALLAELEDEIDFVSPFYNAEQNQYFTMGLRCAYRDAQRFPAADVAPVRHGRWIKESDGGTRCSVCNKRVRNVTGGWYEPVDLSDMPYCPKCGAKMDEPVGNSDRLEENKE